MARDKFFQLDLPFPTSPETGQGFESRTSPWNNGAQYEYIKHELDDEDFFTDDDEPVEVTSEQFWEMRDGIEKRTICPFCRSTMKVHKYERHKGDFKEDRATYGFDLALCTYCFFWQYVGSRWSAAFLMTGASHSLALSKAWTFDEPPLQCHTELAQYLRRNADGWHSLASRDLEQLVASIFKANYANAEVIHVGRPGDGGKDVIFIDADGLTRTLIEVKRRTYPEAVEPVLTVRSLVGALVAESALRGIVVSTASHFSYAAQALATGVAKVGYSIDLIDRGKLDRMLTPLVRKPNYIDLLKRDLPDGAAIPKVRKFFAEDV
jgi:hypothetical protein